MPDSHLISRFVGLSEGVNPFAVAPEGALALADNCVIRSRQILESRRGYSAFTSAVPSNAVGFKQKKVLSLTWNDPSRAVTGQLRYYDLVAGAFTSLPMTLGGLELNSPGGTGAGTRFASVQKAIYFQSRYGLTKIEDIASAACRPAVQPVQSSSNGSYGGVNLVVLNGGTVNWLANGFQTAYRFTLCRRGANNDLIESEPSERIVVSNTSGSAGYVSVQIAWSWMTPPDVFARVYRAKTQIANGSDPTDEMYLVAEVLPSASDRASSSYLTLGNSTTYTDQTSDTQIYVPLYTNAITGSGIAAANSAAPLSRDLFFFKRRLYLFNTTDVQRLTIKVIGTNTGGIVAGDSITIDGNTFGFGAAESNNPPTAQVYTAGTVAQNLENTARSVCRVINYFYGHAFATGLTQDGRVYQPTLPTVILARYISTSSTDAGQVLLQRIVPGAAAFTVKTTSRSGWGSDYTGGVNSDPNAQTAGLMWSNLDQPEGVPLANNAPIGDVSGNGLRGVPLKEAALLFKDNDGLWRVTDDGSALGPVVTIADPTVKLLAPESVVALSNLCFCLVEQGVVAIAENGERVDLSHDSVYRELMKLVAYVGRSTISQYAFGVAYEAEKSYVLCVPESPNATSCTRQFVYNLDTQTWTTWALPGVICGQVNPDTSQLTFGLSPLSQAPAGANAIWQERKAFDSTDYQDPGFSIACPANTATASLVFTGDLRTGTQAIAIGDLVQQAQATNFLQQRVTAVSYSSGANQTTVTLDAAPATAWSNGSNVAIVKAIQCAPKFLPWHAGAPLVSKDWGDVYFAFRLCDLDFITFAWQTELFQIPAVLQERVSGLSALTPTPPIVDDQFAAVPFDTALFDRQTKNLVLKTTLPSQYASCALLELQLTLACALERWELCAVDPRVISYADNVVR